MNKVFVIAEAGDNHNGDLNMALRLVDVAKKAGADAVKFQTFITENVISVNAKMADYQRKNLGIEESQYEMVKKLELSFDKFRIIKDYCDKLGIIFFTTPFDIDSLKFIVNDLRVPILKIPSGEITNYPYLVECAKSNLPIILSTGMCDYNDIDACLKVLYENGANKISLLHCTTEYPAPLSSVNLRAMIEMKKKYHCSIGYSDHTKGIEVSLYAVAMGAEIIEKHFTLDKNLPGPDHKASLEPKELEELVEGIRQLEIILGSGTKMLQEPEKKNIGIARKSIVAKRDIMKDEILSEDNITTKRPGNGISPMRWNEVLGSKASQNFIKDDLIVL